MTSRFRFIFPLMLLILARLAPEWHANAEVKSQSGAVRQVEHKLTIVHPGDASGKAMPHTLVQALDRDGNPISYSMWVNSVICREKTCDVVKVQLHWDAIGRYQRYEVAPGSQLTKLDHVPFTRDDLDKLHRILMDPESPLREVEKESMTAKAPAEKKGKDKKSASVDGVTGATILTLKTAVIIGAGYTCYDLWHWSNGLLTDHIRDYTGRDAKREKLLQYLQSSDQESVLFSLKYLGKRRIADSATYQAVIDRCHKGDEKLIAPALAYLSETASSPEVYHDAVINLFADPDSKKRVLILEALQSDARKHPVDFFSGLSKHLSSVQGYFELHLFLKLIEEKQVNDLAVIKQVAQVLKHKKFFVSRRAYWYLEKQTLPADLRKQVEDYFAAHADRL